ncbi:MAG: 50S ribosomal protein L17 [Calditrichaeota bacterium]|nr:50S ribosomal protein L17 [Calditrichota bacterium]
MRHRKSFAKLNRTAEHRKATLANLASALIERKKIKTTHAKAKAAQRFVEHLVTLAKKGDLNSRRLVLSRLRNKTAMFILFDEIAPSFADRNGGYTRVIHLERRLGDGAEISLLEFVGYESVKHKQKKEEKKTHKTEEEKAEAKKSAKKVSEEETASAETEEKAAKEAPAPAEETSEEATETTTEETPEPPKDEAAPSEPEAPEPDNSKSDSEEESKEK